MDHEKCYVFVDERPSKKRRVDEAKECETSWPLRQRLYQEFWEERRQRIDNVLTRANEVTLDEITTFLRQATQYTGKSQRLPAGFVLAGPSIAAHSTLFYQLGSRLSSEISTLFIVISSAEAPNLKTLLKHVIKTGVARKSTDGDEPGLNTTRAGGRKLLDYDLQLLHEHVHEHHISQVIVSFKDCEAFDSAVLSETIDLLGIWSNRIPFVLFFGIATSIENLQDRLSQSAARSLDGQQFDVLQSEEILEQVFFASTIEESCSLRLGPSLSQMMLQRNQENLLSVEDFVDSVQYSYLSHFHANSLSVLLSNTLRQDDVSPEHIEALRNLPSFRRFAEDSLTSASKARELKEILESDSAMYEHAQSAVLEVRSAMSYLCRVVQIICATHSCISTSKLTASDIYVKAMSGQLQSSPIIRELLMVVKRSPSDVLASLLTAIQHLVPHHFQAEFEHLQIRLADLVAEDRSAEPMKSIHDVRNNTMRTTVVAQKVQLSRHKSKLSARDEAYSKSVTEFVDILAGMLRTMKSPLDMPAHELVIYDLRNPHRAALMPKPRHAIERALYSPHDYLSCDCCRDLARSQANEEGTLSASMPPTALLYRLYLESGSLINVSDLWSAFAAIMEGESEDDAPKVMPSFQRALAELKFLGLIKSTRKKTDHIAKVAWRGL